MPKTLPLLEKYREFLPLTDSTPIVSLGEGNTALVRADNLAARIGRPDLNLHFKLEGLNPTGSFKDRGMTLAISKAVEAGSRAVVCASTGNTSASAAAFSAKAGLSCFVVLPAGYVALGKLAQALVYGARVLPIDGNFDRALELTRALSSDCGLTVVNSINPYRLEGQKTAAFEIVEELGSAPDYLAIPVGNAGNISAYWRGFKLFHQIGRAATRPKMLGFEAEGSAAIVRGKPIEKPETIATAIRIGNPASWQEAAAAASESGGAIDCVSDAEILDAYALLGSSEGIFCEPASAASLAGLIKRIGQGSIEKGAVVVCVLTGNGLKDPDTPLKICQADLSPIPPTMARLKEVIGL